MYLLMENTRWLRRLAVVRLVTSIKVSIDREMGKGTPCITSEKEVYSDCVLLALNRETGEEVAVKFEPARTKFP